MKIPEEMAEEYAQIMSFEVNGHQRGFLAGYNAAQPKWISVKERLPKMNELCIVNTKWRGIVPATYGNKSWIFDEGQGWFKKVLSYVTHWMPLPEPPKENE